MQKVTQNLLRMRMNELSRSRNTKSDQKTRNLVEKGRE